MVKQILVGLVFAGLGGAIIIYSSGLIELFGRIEWFEKNLSGTRNGYVLVGFGVIVLGFLILFGVVPLSPPTEDVGSLGAPASTTNQSVPVTSQ